MKILRAALFTAAAVLVAGLLSVALEPEVVTYKKVGTRDLRLFIHKPPGWKADAKRPAIVFFFSGGVVAGNLGQFKFQSEYLANPGFLNKGARGSRFTSTLIESNRSLASLGWLSGDRTIAGEKTAVAR